MKIIKESIKKINLERPILNSLVLNILDSEKDNVSETKEGKDVRDDFYNSIISEKVNNNIFSSAINAALDVHTLTTPNEKAKNNLLLYRRYIKM